MNASVENSSFVFLIGVIGVKTACFSLAAMLSSSCGLRGTLPSLVGMHDITRSSVDRPSGRPILAARFRPSRARSGVRAARQADKQGHAVAHAALAAAAASLVLHLGSSSALAAG